MKKWKILDAIYAKSSFDQSVSEKVARMCFNAKVTEKYMCRSLFLNKVAGLRYATLLKKELQNSCFPVNSFKNIFFYITLHVAATSIYRVKCCIPDTNEKRSQITAWKVSKYGVFSSLYFPYCDTSYLSVFCPNAEENTGQKKLRIWTLFTQSNVSKMTLFCENSEQLKFVN